MHGHFQRCNMRSYLFLTLSTLLSSSALCQNDFTKLSIESAIDLALAESPELAQAVSKEKAQIEKKRSSWSGLGPRVQATYNEVRFQNELVAEFNNQAFTIRSDRSQVGALRALQPVIGLYALYEYAKVEGSKAKLTELERKSKSRDVAFKASFSWLDAFEAYEQLKVEEVSLRAAQSQLKDAQALQRVGRLNRGDVLKLELQVSESKARLALAKSWKKIAFTQLKEIVGLPLKTDLKLLKTLPKLETKKLALEEALSRALDQRLEKKQAEQAIPIAEFSKKLAYSKFAPSVNVFVQVERNFGSRDAFGQSEKDTRTFGIQATWDLWNNGETVFEVREASYQIRQAEEQVRSSETMIRVDLISAMSRLKAAEEALEFSRIAVEQAEEAYRIEKAKFLSGKSSASDLILAESSSKGSKSRLVNAESEKVRQHLNLQKALGEERPKFKTL